MTRSFLVRVLARRDGGGELVARVQAVETDEEYVVHSVEELAGVLTGETTEPEEGDR